LASKSFESGIESMPALFNQVIFGLVFIGVVLLIANKYIKGNPVTED